MAGSERKEHGYLQIGEVAERIGVTQRTLRFYEEKGLLKPPTRMDGGFRLYSDDDVQRVERIRQLQKLLGFALSEIKEMVEADEIKGQIRAGWRQDGDAAEKRIKIERVLDITEKQHTLIRQKVEQLQEMQKSLENKLITYRGWLDQLEAAESPSPSSEPQLSR